MMMKTRKNLKNQYKVKLNIGVNVNQKEKNFAEILVYVNLK